MIYCNQINKELEMFMEGRKQIIITLKLFVLILLISIGLLSITLIIYALKVNGIFGRLITGTTLEHSIGFVNYEGTFKAKGVVVRPEKDVLIIMPIVENKEEYRAESKFYYENNKELSIKQGQEIKITFHYRQSAEDIHLHETVIENIEIIKEESNTEIPHDILVEAYSSKDNISISLNKEKSNISKMEFEITDTNEFKYDYSTMKYKIYKYNPPPTKTEITYDGNGGASISGYDPWPELKKLSNLSTEANYKIDENNTINVSLDWSQVYGELGEGKYILTFSSVLKQRTSITNPNVIEYPYDGVIIDVNFMISEEGKIDYTEIAIR